MPRSCPTAPLTYLSTIYDTRCVHWQGRMGSVGVGAQPRVIFVIFGLVFVRPEDLPVLDRRLENPSDVVGLASSTGTDSGRGAGSVDIKPRYRGQR